MVNLLVNLKFSFEIHEGLLHSNLGDLCNVTLNKLDKILTTALGSHQQVQSSTGYHFSLLSTKEMQHFDLDLCV